MSIKIHLKSGISTLAGFFIPCLAYMYHLDGEEKRKAKQRKEKKALDL